MDEVARNGKSRFMIFLFFNLKTILRAKLDFYFDANLATEYGFGVYNCVKCHSYCIKCYKTNIF